MCCYGGCSMTSSAPSSPPSPPIFRPWQPAAPTNASPDASVDKNTPFPHSESDASRKRPRHHSDPEDPPPHKVARTDAVAPPTDTYKMAAAPLLTDFRFPGACLPAGGTLGGLVPLLGGLVPAAEVERVCARRPRPKRFACGQCGSAFSNKGQLKGHVRIHTGERPFACSHRGCHKRFTRNEELTRHARIHSGARPFPCPLCDKRFGRKDHLKKHVRTHQRPLLPPGPAPPRPMPPLPPMPPLSLPTPLPPPLSATLASLAASQPLFHHLHLSHLHHLHAPPPSS